MQKALITGGAGFIGSSLAEILLQRGYQVRIFDNLTRNSMAAKVGLIDHPNLQMIQGDVLDFPALREACEDCTLVIHCAAIAGIDSVIKSPAATLRVNLVGTANLLEAVRQAGVATRVINFSTSEIFGNRAFGATEEDNAVTGSAGEARWCYAVSKLSGEHLSLAYFKEYGVPVVTIRPFNVYGPGQVGEGALQIFVKRALANQDLMVFGHGHQIRAWCYVDDFIRALGILLEHPNAPGESFNIGNSRAVVTIYGLANTVVRVLGSSSKVIFAPARSADIELRIPSVEKAKELLGFEAQIDLEEGIAKTGEYFRSLGVGV
jgi:UDP-glucose 4-epimerase